jgi:hypothetical protein
MLSTDQISVLQYIVDNQEELIIALAEENNIKSDASLGVAHFLLGDANNFSKMSSHQKFHYENSIKPLIYRVLCDGMLGEHEDGSSSCIGDGFIDEESLFGAYLEQDMRCQHCVQSADTWHANNP